MKTLVRRMAGHGAAATALTVLVTIVAAGVKF
jgi:hypothetical protein